MKKRPIRTVYSARRMHRKGFGVSEISKRLKIPHQTVSDWIHNRRRPERHREPFRKMEKRPIRTVYRVRSMHRKGFRVSEISKRLKLPHQTVSDWISGRRRPERHKEKFKTQERFERPEEPAFDAKCPDCGGQMVKVSENRGAQVKEHQFNSFWKCEGCGLNAKTLGGKIVSAWLGE